MAKPKSLVDLASTATSSTSHLPAHEARPRRPTPSTTSPRPSANLLALLATVAASSSSADGRPLSSDASPPDFLCPFLPPHFLADHTPSSRRDNAWEEHYEDDHHQGAPTPTRVRRRRRSGPLPEKYVEGVDGRWRKEHSWTLYGSSYCDCSTNTGDLSQTDAPEVDDQVDPTALPTTSSTSTATSPDMTVSLPPGWDRSSKNTDLTPYILSLSLVLAVGIVLLIFGCVIWRRKRRGVNQDLETKLRKHRALDDDIDDELDDIARARAQQRRLWVKATARWRPNVKISARRRRKKVGTSVSSDVSSIQSKAESSATGASPSMEMLSLESSSIATEVTNNPLLSAAPPLATTVPDGETPPSEGHEPFLDVPSQELRLSHPPDYREDGAKVGARGDGDLPPHSVTSEDASLDDSPQTAQMTRSTMTLPHVSAAHIATDDKSLLARMATLVSSPPEEDAFTAPQSSHDAVVAHRPSVPIIEEFEELSSSHLETMHRDSGKGAEVVWSNHLSSSSTSYQPALSNNLPVPTYSREPSPRPPMFPAPPPKAQLAGFQYYEYSSAFEADMVETPSDPQPSAPMFGYPSAPEDDSSQQLEAVPCAPPLIDEEDELHLGLGRAYAPIISPLTDDVEAVRTSSDSTSPAPSGASTSHPSSQLERTTRPPDYLP